MISRMIQATKAKNTTQMLDMVGFSNSSASAWKRRGNIPEGSIARVAARTGVNLEWLKTGQGAMKPAGQALNTLDRELTGEIIAFIIETANDLGVQLKPEKVKELLFMLHDEYANGREIDRDKIVQLVHLAA